MPTCKYCSVQYKLTQFNSIDACEDCDAVIEDDYEEDATKFFLKEGKTEAVFSEDRDTDYLSFKAEGDL